LRRDTRALHTAAVLRSVGEGVTLNVTFSRSAGSTSHTAPWSSRSTLRGAGSEGDPQGTARSSPHHPAFASHCRCARALDRLCRPGQSAITDRCRPPPV